MPYYRLKTTPTATGKQELPIYVNGKHVCTHILDIRCVSGNDVLLKYLDNDGQYRFIKVFGYYKQSAGVSVIGQTQVYISDLATVSPFRIIGQKSEAKAKGSTDWLNLDESKRFADLLVSPLIYMEYNGYWHVVSVSASNDDTKVGKNNLISYELTITLPTNNTITML